MLIKSRCFRYSRRNSKIGTDCQVLTLYILVHVSLPDNHIEKFDRQLFPVCNWCSCLRISIRKYIFDRKLFSVCNWCSFLIISIVKYSIKIFKIPVWYMPSYSTTLRTHWLLYYVITVTITNDIYWCSFYY